MQRYDDYDYSRKMESSIDLYVNMLRLAEFDKMSLEECENVVIELEKAMEFNNGLIKKIMDNMKKIPLASNVPCHRRTLDSFIEILSECIEDDISTTTLREIADTIDIEISNIVNNNIDIIDDDF